MNSEHTEVKLLPVISSHNSGITDPVCPEVSVFFLYLLIELSGLSASTRMIL